MPKETRLYDLLCVPVDADPSQIKKAYRARALKYHPDKLRDVKDEATRKQHTELFQEITRAYEVLSDEHQRYIYDNYGEKALENGALAETNSGMPTNSTMPGGANMFSQAESLFNHLFGGMGMGAMPGMPGEDRDNFFDDPFDAFRHFRGEEDNFAGVSGGNTRHHRGPDRGRDIHHTVYCTLSDFYHGKTMKLSLVKKIKCKKCHGQGGFRRVTCTACNGNGVIINERRMGHMFQRTSETCRQCGGLGHYIPEDSICNECQGNRLIDTKVILPVVIPRGASPGYKVVFPKGADEGVDIIPGDVIITFQRCKRKDIKDPEELDIESRFQVNGDDLLTSIKVPLVTAICGGVVPLKHIDGSTLSIYVGRGELQGNGDLRLVKNRGMPISTNEPGSSREVIGYGDLYVKFKVELPRAGELSEQQYSALKQVLGQPTGDDHRVRDEDVVYPSEVDVTNCPEMEQFPKV